MTVPSRFEPHKTFAINTPSDMLAKLERELNRVANSSFLHDDLLDHGTNCALTAWSLTDWVWHALFKDDPAAQDDLVPRDSDLRSSEKSYGKGNATPTWFKEYVTRECPELAFCQDIANAFKHADASIPDNRKSPGVQEMTASAKVIVSPVFTLGKSALGSAVLGGPGVAQGAQEYTWKILDSHGNRHNAKEVFNSAVAFWTYFLDKHHVV